MDAWRLLFADGCAHSGAVVAGSDPLRYSPGNALAAVVVELRKERDALAAAGDPDALARKEQDERERLERAEARDRRDD